MALLVSRRINDPSYNNLYFKSDVLSLMNVLRSGIDDGLLRSFDVSMPPHQAKTHVWQTSPVHSIASHARSMQPTTH